MSLEIGIWNCGFAEFKLKVIETAKKQNSVRNSLDSGSKGAFDSASF